MGDAMSHAVFPGIVLAWIAGIPLAIGAFIAGLFCAVATGYLDDNSRIKRDTLMGIVFSGMFGAGLVLYVSIQSEVHLDHILFGDMLGVSLSDIMQTAVITLGIALIIGLKWKDLLLHAFDPHQAKASGLNTALLHYGLLCMIALTIVATLKSVGIILSILADCARRHCDFNDAKVFSRLVAGGGYVCYYLVYGRVSVIFHRQCSGPYHRRTIFPAVCDYLYLFHPARPPFRTATPA